MSKIKKSLVLPKKDPDFWLVTIMVRTILGCFQDCDVKVRQSHVLLLVFVSIHLSQKGATLLTHLVSITIQSQFGRHVYEIVTMLRNGNKWKHYGNRLSQLDRIVRHCSQLLARCRIITISQHIQCDIVVINYIFVTDYCMSDISSQCLTNIHIIIVSSSSSLSCFIIYIIPGILSNLLK